MGLKRNKYTEDPTLYDSVNELEAIIFIANQGRKIVTAGKRESEIPSLYRVLKAYGLVKFQPVTVSLKEKWAEHFDMPCGNAADEEEKRKQDIEVVLSPKGYELYLSLCDFYREKTKRSP
ncbi:MAG: hypothetical protein V1660_03200 [archaeon]